MADGIKVDTFGKTNEGEPVHRFTIENKNGLKVRLIEYGAIVTEIVVPDKEGQLRDVTLGFDDIEGYVKNGMSIGSLVGRVANRIAKGQFELNGETYHLPINNGPNTLHGGNKGFDKVLWTGKVDGDNVRMTYVSRDGEEGFPGELTVTVSFQLTDDNQLLIHYEAETTKDTPVDITNHSYFNLAGHGTPDLKGHVVTINADHYLPVDEYNVPTGEIIKVEGTLMDLRTGVDIAQRITEVNQGRGFDNTFCVGEHSDFRLVARLEHPGSGRYLEQWTTQPASHFYTAHYLNGCSGKGGAIYPPSSAFCLEAQHYPDSVHHENFPNTILKKGESYQHRTAYKFGTM